MKNSPLFILEPPYTMARRLMDQPPALGAVALLDAVVDRPTTNDVKGQMEEAPWCPLCLLADSESGMRSTRRLPRTCVVFGLDEGDGASGILKAVSSRPRPTPSDLVDWIVRRTRLSSLARTLSDLFSRPTLRRNEAAFLPYALREQMRMLGDWSALEWQRAAMLAELAADRSLLNRTMSGDDDTSAELRGAMRELLGVAEREFHNRYGWEWVLEASLRRSHFFERSARGVRPLHQRPAAIAPMESWGKAVGAETYASPRLASA
ncbi:MAG: hypothetical protein IT361_04955 [Gemmatimonadaceae bacterium]|nr:hypothetical protein [Gemmatimonadaceae bacterium]